MIECVLSWKTDLPQGLSEIISGVTLNFVLARLRKRGKGVQGQGFPTLALLTFWTG